MENNMENTKDNTKENNLDKGKGKAIDLPAPDACDNDDEKDAKQDAKQDEEKKNIPPKRPFPESIWDYHKRAGGQKRMRLLAPPAALAMRPKDENGNIKLRLVEKYKDEIPANKPGIWKKLVDKKQVLPDELLVMVFHHLADIWQTEQGPHFKTVAHDRLLSVWQGCKFNCCTIPKSLFVNRLARDAVMDRMRFNAQKSDGYSHIVIPVFAKSLTGLAIADFGRGKVGEPFYRPVFNARGHDITMGVVEAEEAEAAAKKIMDDEKANAMDVDDKDVDIKMDDLKL